MRVVQVLLLATVSAGMIACGGEPQTPLVRAAFEGRVDEVADLLDKGADLATTEHFAGTALHAAARAGHVPVIKLLVSRGASINARGGVNGWTPLMHAIHKGQNDAALALMALGADIHVDREHALHMAAGAANVAMVRALLSAGADPHQRGGALMAEAVGGSWDIDNRWQGCEARTQVVKVLLDKAPDLRMSRHPLSHLSLAYVQRKGCTELLALVN